MLVHGKCHCGQISFQAEIDPSKVAICHCSDCQHFTGSAYRVSIPAPAENFKMTGTPKIYFKVADSGKRRAQAFCSNCGSAIYSSDEKDVKVYTIRLGSLEERKALKPSRQIWCESALPNFENIQQVPKNQRQ